MMGAKRKRIAKLEAQLDDASESFQRCSTSLEGVRQDLGQCQDQNRSLRETTAALREAKNLAVSQRQDALDRVGQLIETRDRLMAERDRARESMMQMGQGILAIHGERLTHTSEHDYDAQHDDQCHGGGQLAVAAACYAAPELIYEADHGTAQFVFTELWPWPAEEDRRRRPFQAITRDSLTDHRRNRIHELVKAGSLIAAEIERLIRQGGSERPAGILGPTREEAEAITCGRLSTGIPPRVCDLLADHQGPHSWEHPTT